MSRLDFSQVSVVHMDVRGWDWEWMSDELFGDTGGIQEPLRDEVHQALAIVLLRAGQMSTTEFSFACFLS